MDFFWAEFKKIKLYYQCVIDCSTGFKTFNSQWWFVDPKILLEHFNESP